MDLRYSKLSSLQINRLLEHFVAGTTARMAAELTGLNRNTARVFFHRLRELIAHQLEDEGDLTTEQATVSKKTFVRVASILKRLKPKMGDAHGELVGELAKMFKEMNPRFDVQRFTDAAGS